MKTSLHLVIIFHITYTILRGYPGGSDGRENACNAGDLVDPWVGKIPWRRDREPTPVFLPGESPWTEESGRLQYMRSQTVRHDCTKRILFQSILFLATIFPLYRADAKNLSSLG